jgi:hypothetical protein
MSQGRNISERGVDKWKKSADKTKMQNFQGKLQEKENVKSSSNGGAAAPLLLH